MIPFLAVWSLNLCLLFWWVDRRARAHEFSQREALDVGLAVAVGGFVGGRLLHVVWEAPDYYAEDFMRVFDIGAGGFVYFGGLALALAGGYAVTRLRGLSFAEALDFYAPVVSLGTAIGRLGCLVAGCCYGTVCSLPWAMPVLDEHGLRLLRHPAPLYAAIWEIGVLAILLGIEKAPRAVRPRWLSARGSVFAVWLALHSVGRFLVEFVRDDFRGDFIGRLSLGQTISIALFLSAVGFLARASHSENA